MGLAKRTVMLPKSPLSVWTIFTTGFKIRWTIWLQRKKKKNEKKAVTWVPRQQNEPEPTPRTRHNRASPSFRFPHFAWQNGIWLKFIGWNVRDKQKFMHAFLTEFSTFNKLDQKSQQRHKMSLKKCSQFAETCRLTIGSFKTKSHSLKALSNLKKDFIRKFASRQLEYKWRNFCLQCKENVSLGRYCIKPSDKTKIPQMGNN